MTALYVRHPSSLEHETGAHPESPQRIRAIEAALEEVGWLGLEVVEAPAATREQLERVHTATHIDSIAELCRRGGGGAIDADTIASEGSYNAALHAAGGAVHAVDRLMEAGANGYGFAFCALRPPGHHAESDRAMGFCLFNNIAAAATHALVEHAAERVLIVDWDVHHGNGTEEIFYEKNEVLYASLHQSPLYPGTGAATDTGQGEGKGYTINLPQPPGAGREEFLGALTKTILPRARDWKPNLICISAGYDAHRNDPLADCNLDTPDYAEMSKAIRTLAQDQDIPVLTCLEGGYNLEALAAAVQATIEVFAEA